MGSRIGSRGRWAEISGRRHIFTSGLASSGPVTLVLQYFGQYGRRIVRDGQAIGPRGQGRPRYTTSGSVTSSWLASSVKVRVLQLCTAQRRAVVVRGLTFCVKMSQSIKVSRCYKYHHYIRPIRIKWPMSDVPIFRWKNPKSDSGFPLSFDIEIQGLSRTLKFHFQGPILDGSLQHEH